MLNKDRIKRKISGFTLAETVISIALLAVVLITVCGVFVHSTRAIKKGRYKLAGLNLAEKKISEIRNLFALLPEDGLINCQDILYSSPASPGIVSHSDTLLEGGSFIEAGTEVEIWKTPYRSLEIKGTEFIPQTGDYDFYIILEDYIAPEAPENIDGMKKMTVKISWIEPQVGTRDLEIKTVLSRPPE